MDMYGFYTGKILNAYEYLGCHLTEDSAYFRTFAPAAVRIAVIGDFNDWTETQMYQVNDANFWECRISGVQEGMRYKYRIYRRDGGCVDHADPYGFSMEKPPMSASIVRNLYQYQWKDEAWMKNRTDCRRGALNIYELHLGSWRQKPEGGCYSYQEIAGLLIPYLKEKGYNYMELMPIGEHPCDNSWGYQQTGLYSPTARYGSPEELRYLIDSCHQNGIGVLLDFVPVHFAVDAYGLAEYDGSSLYEYPNIDVGMSEWGSKNFNHSRGEIQSFLQSCACYWIKEFHFDGVRIDALSNIIYWHGDKRRGVNQNAVAFIRHMNSSLKRMYPSVMLIAEDSTAYDGVTRPVEQNGLGFDYKWDMGWMNDTLSYFQTNPSDRTRDYHKLTFSMMYYYSERFLLPLSHDEVVHGKATILQKMNGQYDDKFPQARAFYLYMYTHPGKKLIFMGNEFGQMREWDESRQQDWNILTYPKHDAFARFMSALNHLYLQSPALYEADFEQNGFTWIDCHQEEKCIYAFERKGGGQRLVVLFNFSDQKQEYTLKVNDCQKLKLLLASDMQEYDGGKDYGKEMEFAMTDGEIEMELNPFSGRIFEV